MKFSQLSLFAPVCSLIAKSTLTARFLTTRPEPRAEPVSNLELERIWREVRAHYFPDRPDIDRYIVHWSRRRQKRTLASCNVRARRVVVARELDRPEHSCWLEPLLYHEMCHAVIGTAVERRGRKRQWHGREFRTLEALHPRIRDLDHWIKTGGWFRAVRSDRARTSSRRRTRRV